MIPQFHVFVYDRNARMWKVLIRSVLPYWIVWIQKKGRGSPASDALPCQLPMPLFNRVVAVDDTDAAFAGDGNDLASVTVSCRRCRSGYSV